MTWRGLYSIMDQASRRLLQRERNHIFSPPRLVFLVDIFVQVWWGSDFTGRVFKPVPLFCQAHCTRDHQWVVGSIVSFLSHISVHQGPKTTRFQYLFSGSSTTMRFLLFLSFIVCNSILALANQVRGSTVQDYSDSFLMQRELHPHAQCMYNSVCNSLGLTGKCCPVSYMQKQKPDPVKIKTLHLIKPKLIFSFHRRSTMWC